MYRNLSERVPLLNPPWGLREEVPGGGGLSIMTVGVSHKVQ